MVPSVSTVASPLAGSVVIITEPAAKVPSLSESLASTLIVTSASATTVAVSFTAIGASFGTGAPVTVTITVSVSDAPASSVTTRSIV